MQGRSELGEFARTLILGRAAAACITSLRRAWILSAKTTGGLECYMPVLHYSAVNSLSRVRGEHEVDTRIRHQVGLELGNVDVQSTIETKRCSER